MNEKGEKAVNREDDEHGSAECQSHSHPTENKVGVLPLNLGGSETVHEVQPFLFNLFADLAHALRIALEAKNLPVNIYVGMRYWYLFTEEIKRDKITRLVVQPLYLQFSISTVGLSILVLEKIFREDAYLSKMPVSIIRSWYHREGYIKSMAALIQKELGKFLNPEEVMIFFSGHGVPVSFAVNAGDIYRDQMEECIYLTVQNLKRRGVAMIILWYTRFYFKRNPTVQVGPIQWVKPYTDEVLDELSQKGVMSLLAVPVSLVSQQV
ncbi:ferrochelatase-2, chloroplastic-like [Mangifera indica]|uniref:ferrochelatase-2, chloroplastic-like n=1 Tax=Mangifera indica TaxID=29780 RepID=UPI001CFC453A|nr:ferrochelatase-2, chloroplastic-like [Mangifera indica]